MFHIVYFLCVYWVGVLLRNSF